MTKKIKTDLNFGCIICLPFKNCSLENVCLPPQLLDEIYAHAFMLSLYRLEVLHGISCQVPNSELAGEVTFIPDSQQMFSKLFLRWLRWSPP